MKGKPLISALCFIGIMISYSGASAYSSTKTGGKGGIDGGAALNMTLLIILVLLITVCFIIFLKKRKGRTVKESKIKPESLPLKTASDTKKKRKPPREEKNVSLFCINGEYAGRSLDCEGAIILGRNPDVCNLIFADKSSGISGIHCILENKDGKIILTDKSSTYGTYLGNGVRLTPETPYIMNHSDEFYLGSRNNLFIIK